MTMGENLRDLKASGAVSVSGGQYRDVSVSGSARISGDVTCERFDASGSARVAGNVACEKYASSGSTHIDGNVAAGEMRTSGAASVDGSLEASGLQSSGSFRVDGDAAVTGEVRVSGSARFGGALKARAVNAAGSLRVARGIECEQLLLQGAFDVDGLINAGTAEIELAGQSSLEEIGGERVTVRRRGGLNVLGIQIPFLTGSLTAGTIEATSVYLEATRAKVVRGADVTIASGCEIDRVEYSGALSVVEDAVVREKVKVE